MKTIKICCKDVKTFIPLDKFKPLQGKLKVLTEENYQNLSTEMIDTGFPFPPYVWKSGHDVFIIGGHQRIAALRRLLAEKVAQLPDNMVPVIVIEAKSADEAKRRVLQDIAQYGTITSEGLHNFIKELRMDLPDLKKYPLPNVDISNFNLNFYSQISMKANRPEQSSDVVEIGKVKPHPDNFRRYPDDQLDHIIDLVKESGLYRSIVTTNDGTILLGHGSYAAALKIGLKYLNVRRLDLEPSSTKALKIMINDHELGHLSEIDDRKLSEILKYIKENDPTGLKGTGYDEKMLANLLFVTRPASEIKDIDEAAHWVGLPEYGENEIPPKIMINFEKENDRQKVIDVLKVKHVKKLEKVWTFWWPDRERRDMNSVRFVGDKKDESKNPAAVKRKPKSK